MPKPPPMPFDIEGNPMPRKGPRPRDPNNGVGWAMVLAAFVFAVALVVGMMALGGRPVLF